MDKLIDSNKAWELMIMTEIMRILRQDRSHITK